MHIILYEDYNVDTRILRIHVFTRQSFEQIKWYIYGQTQFSRRKTSSNNISRATRILSCAAADKKLQKPLRFLRMKVYCRKSIRR